MHIWHCHSQFIGSEGGEGNSTPGRLFVCGFGGGDPGNETGNLGENGDGGIARNDDLYGFAASESGVGIVGRCFSILEQSREDDEVLLRQCTVICKLDFSTLAV